MNTEKTWQTVSSSSDNTFAIGERLGRACKGGEIFVLSSDLGGGKTTFTKGLAKGMGSVDVVVSPTFMVNRVYMCTNGLELHHYDFYRLNEGGMVERELAEIINDPKAITVVEWGDIISSTLPGEHIAVEIVRLATGENERGIKITYPVRYKYLFEGQS